MSKNYKFIIRDTKDLKHNIELLTEDEQLAQFDMCAKLCNAVLSNKRINSADIPLIEYCSTRLGDLLDYTLLLAETVKEENIKNIKYLKILKDIQARVDKEGSKIADYFRTDRIDWSYIINL